MKKILLTQNKYTFIDNKDFEVVSKFKWFFNGNYAVSSNNSYLHRFIMKPKKGLEVDHINRDKLDNRRKNLRVCTRSENERNKPMKSNNTCGIKGVYFHKPLKNWRARIMVNGKQIHLGLFDKKEKAGIAYNEGAKKYHKEFALLNNIN